MNSSVKVLLQELIFVELKIGLGKTPNPEILQGQILDVTINQSSKREIDF